VSRFYDKNTYTLMSGASLTSHVTITLHKYIQSNHPATPAKLYIADRGDYVGEGRGVWVVG
jgi:hypothetical protein